MDGEKNNRMERNRSKKDRLVDIVVDGSMMSERIWGK
jgi:hypothetical protein